MKYRTQQKSSQVTLLILGVQPGFASRGSSLHPGATTGCKNSGDTLPYWGVLNSPHLLHTVPPPSHQCC